MENKDPEGTSGRKLGVGDYVEYVGDKEGKILKWGVVYTVTEIESDTLTPTSWPYKLNNTPYWIKSKCLKKITQQEYIVAKLKGKLYV